MHAEIKEITKFIFIIKSITRSFHFSGFTKNDVNLVKLVFRLYFPTLHFDLEYKVEMLVLLNLHHS